MSAGLQLSSSPRVLCFLTEDPSDVAGSEAAGSSGAGALITREGSISLIWARVLIFPTLTLTQSNHLINSGFSGRAMPVLTLACEVERGDPQSPGAGATPRRHMHTGWLGTQCRGPCSDRHWCYIGHHPLYS